MSTRVPTHGTSAHGRSGHPEASVDRGCDRAFGDRDRDRDFGRDLLYNLEAGTIL
jgi:hypothetical protein